MKEEKQDWNIGKELDKLIKISRHEYPGQVTHKIAEIECEFQEQRKQACQEMIEYMEEQCPPIIVEQGIDKQGMEYKIVQSQRAIEAAKEYLDSISK